jgi:DNA-binding GntR family transcriptional regulator
MKATQVTRDRSTLVFSDEHGNVLERIRCRGIEQAEDRLRNLLGEPVEQVALQVAEQSATGQTFDFWEGPTPEP